MRAEKAKEAPEEFENAKPSKAVVQKPTTPLNPQVVEKTSPPKPTPPPISIPPAPYKNLPPARQPKLVITETDKILEFRADIMGTYSQTSGTNSYDSVKSLAPAYVETVRKQEVKVVFDSKEEPKVAEEQLIVIGRRPAIELIDDVQFNRSLYQEKQGADFVPILPSSAPFRGRRELDEAKHLLNDAMTQYVKSGRDDIDLVFNMTREGVLPIISMKFAKAKSSN